MAKQRIAVKRVDLECISLTLQELADWLRQRASVDNCEATICPVPLHLVDDAQYFWQLCVGILNHAPRL